MYVSDPTTIARISSSKELNRKLRYFETNEALWNDFVITCQTDFATTCSRFKPFSETNQHSTCYDATNIKPFNNDDISQLCLKALLDGRRASMPQLMVVLGVTSTTSWQQDRLVQRELFDKKTSRVVPDYYDIEVRGFDGLVYGYWPNTYSVNIYYPQNQYTKTMYNICASERDTLPLSLTGLDDHSHWWLMKTTVNVHM